MLFRSVEKKLSELQGQGGPAAGAEPGKTILSKDQQEAIEQFRGELVQTRRELRDVQRELRRDIEGLELLLKFVNIWLIPILVAVAAVLVGVVRMRRRAHSRRRPVTGHVT